MRWPLRRKSPVEPAPRRDRPDPPTTGDERKPRTAPTAAHPDRSRPRADWAHLAPLVPATASSPPVTFHGARFGRSVAGARPIAGPARPRPSGRGPAGVLRDVAHVETVLPPPPPPIPTDAPDAPDVPDVARPERPPVVHRKPTAVAATGVAAIGTPLTTSDLDVELPGHRPAAPPPPEEDAIAPATWTPEEGFVEEQPTGAETAAGMRLVGRRGSFEDAVRPPAGAPGEPATAGDRAGPAAGVTTLRYVPAPGPRRSPPPGDLVDTVRRATGVHVADAVIDRSPEAAARAAELGAVAFAEGTTVHLPAELGPIEDRAVRAVAAHELTHVAQQRARGGAVPPEASDEGRALEAQARAVQRSVAAGAGPVTPTFLRRATAISGAPAGVQRLADDGGWTGADWSETDLSDVEPGSAGDPFAWQERTGEPSGGPWEDRRAFAERYESEHATTLQRRRDERYGELVDEAAEPGGVGTGGVGRDHAPAIRRRLDTEMPYQFGPPFGIEPYPDLAPPPPAPPATSSTPTTEAGRAAPAVTGAPGPLAPAPAAAGGGDEAAAGATALRHLAASSRAAHRRDDTGEVGSLAEVADRLQARLALERRFRIEVLDAKLAAARSAGADDDHVVGLTAGEIDEIREAVELQLPLRVGHPQYLDTDVAASVTMDGVHGAMVATGGGRGPMSHPSRRSSTSRPGSARSATRATDPGPGPATPADEPDPTEAEQILERLTREAGEAHDPGQVGVAHSLSELLGLFERRRAREIEMRTAVLAAKRAAAVAAGAGSDHVVSLSDEEIQRIRDAVDLEIPVAVAHPQYVGTDESASMRMTGELGAIQPIEPIPVTPAGPRSPAATSAGPPAASPTPPGEAGAPDTGGGGAHVSALGALAMAAGDEPHAGDAHAALVVESMSELDLELLARRLWGRLRRELRGELLIDRERAGALADIR